MNTQETIDLLYKLKLKGMSEAYKAISMSPVSERPDMDLAVAKLAEAERRYRDNQKTQMYLKTSRIRYNSNLEDVECSEAHNLTKTQLSEPKKLKTQFTLSILTEARHSLIYTSMKLKAIYNIRLNFFFFTLLFICININAI
ncbi:MAG: ATP-binding protein [Bacteroidales bacterium]|jgi:hypothetical protein|nr:ATP-binding protein [Bacteroidales bacterium]